MARAGPVLRALRIHLLLAVRGIDPREARHSLEVRSAAVFPPLSAALCDPPARRRRPVSVPPLDRAVLLLQGERPQGLRPASLLRAGLARQLHDVQRSGVVDLGGGRPVPGLLCSMPAWADALVVLG